MNVNYKWTQFYEAAVLETNSEALPKRIETAQNAIGQRVITLAVDEAERRAIVRALDTLGTLKRERRPQYVCDQCLDSHEPVNSSNGQTFLAKTGTGEIAVTLHTRCVNAWADVNSFQALVPLRKARAAGQR